MAVTSKQIAEAAGVSRGTVYRALNNTGRINPEVAEKIRLLAKEMNYQPNRAGQALVMTKKAATIGVILQTTDTPFMKKVLEGVLEAKGEMELLGVRVLVREIPDVDAEQVASAMEDLKQEGCGGIALTAVENQSLREIIARFKEEQIPVVTFNSDLKESERLCFVGQDALQGGRAAGGLMAEILPEKKRILLISGHPANRSHKDRARGFIEALKEARNDLKLLDVQYAFDDDEMAALITRRMLEEYEDLSGIYLAASGLRGVCETLEQRGLTGKVKVISNDLTEYNLQCLREGSVNFLIGQDDFMQGYEPVRILYDRLADGKDPVQEFNYTEIVIKTKYNV